MPLITAFNLRKEDRLPDIENALRRALVSMPELKINDDEIDFVPVSTPDGFHGQVTRINVDLWEMGRKSSHEGSASRAGRESRHSLSRRHWIGSKSEGRHSALRCRGGGVGLALINNAIGAIATAGGAVRASLNGAPLRRWMWSCLNRWFPTLRLFDHII